MKEINLILGQRIKARRKTLKLTREQLAEKINVSVRFMADVEKGQVGVSISTLKELCNALECSADYFIGLDQNPQKNEYAVAINKLEQLPTECMPYMEKILSEMQAMLQSNKV